MNIMARNAWSWSHFSFWMAFPINVHGAWLNVVSGREKKRENNTGRQRDVIGSIRYCAFFSHFDTIHRWPLHATQWCNSTNVGCREEYGVRAAQTALTKFKFMLSHGVVKGVKSIFCFNAYAFFLFSSAALMRIILHRIWNDFFSLLFSSFFQLNKMKMTAHNDPRHDFVFFSLLDSRLKPREKNKRRSAAGQDEAATFNSMRWQLSSLCLITKSVSTRMTLENIITVTAIYIRLKTLFSLPISSLSLSLLLYVSVIHDF